MTKNSEREKKCTTPKKILAMPMNMPTPGKNAADAHGFRPLKHILDDRLNTIPVFWPPGLCKLGASILGSTTSSMQLNHNTFLCVLKHSTQTHSKISNYDLTITSSAQRWYEPVNNKPSIFWHHIYFGTSEASRGQSAEPTVVHQVAFIFRSKARVLFWHPQSSISERQAWTAYHQLIFFGLGLRVRVRIAYVQNNGPLV